MCTLLHRFRADPVYTHILAANRDEAYDRPATPPAVLPGAPRILCARDQRAGGTWLGLNEHGLLVAVANLRTGRPADPAKRSRGQLVLDCLRQPTLAAARALAEETAAQHNPFNLILADAKSRVVLSFPDDPRPTTNDPTTPPPTPPRTQGGESAVVVSPPLRLSERGPGGEGGSDVLLTTDYALGSLVITNGLPNDRAIPNVAEGLALLDALGDADTDTLVAKLGAACAQHGDPGAGWPAFCVHGERGGTVSSTMLLLADDPARSQYLYAPGPPCVTAYKDYTHLLRELRGA